MDATFPRQFHSKQMYLELQDNIPLSFGPVTSGKLKNCSDIKKWTSLKVCLSVRGLQHTVVWTVLVQSAYESSGALRL